VAVHNRKREHHHTSADRFIVAWRQKAVIADGDITPLFTLPTREMQTHTHSQVGGQFTGQLTSRANCQIAKLIIGTFQQAVFKIEFKSDTKITDTKRIIIKTFVAKSLEDT